MTELEHVVVRPGDTLILRVARRLSMAEFDELISTVRAEVAEPLGVKVVVIEADQILVCRPGGTCAHSVVAPIGGHTLLCELPPGHDGEHQAEQPGTVPARWRSGP